MGPIFAYNNKYPKKTILILKGSIMKTVGIIAEYNPFHNGHKYHLDEVRRQTGADYLVVVMSGDFTQRGLPAIIDKYSRARMALDGGADLVLELPVCYATGSAAWFAEGATALLDSLGCIDLLSFGSECGNIDRLTATAKTLSEESPAFTETLKRSLKEGLSYPAARETALQSSLSTPNDILGVEYCKSLFKINSAIIPHTIRRLGGAYDDPTLHEHRSSALAIRNALYRPDLFLSRKISEPDDNGCTASAARNHAEDCLGAISDQVPPCVYDILSSEFGRTFPVFPDLLSAQLHYKLISEADQGVDTYFDVSADLSNRIRKLLPDYRNFTQFCDLLKTKQLTHTRVSRSLMHILLGIHREDMEDYRNAGTVFYARMLGFRRSSTPLLGAIKEHSRIPLISKLADAPSLLTDIGNHQLAQDIRAAHIYQSMVQHTFGTAPKQEQCREIISV